MPQCPIAGDANAVCQFSAQTSKGQNQGDWTSKNLKNDARLPIEYILLLGCGSRFDCKLDLVIVRPSLLSAPKTLGS